LNGRQGKKVHGHFTTPFVTVVFYIFSPPVSACSDSIVLSTRVFGIDETTRRRPTMINSAVFSRFAENMS